MTGLSVSTAIYLHSIENIATQFTAEYAVAITSEKLAKSRYLLTTQGGVEPVTFRFIVRHAIATLTCLALYNITNENLVYKLLCYSLLLFSNELYYLCGSRIEKEKNSDGYVEVKGQRQTERDRQAG